MTKLAAIAGLVALLIAVLAAFMEIPGIDAGVAMVLLGIIAGLGYTQDRFVGLMLAVLVYTNAATAAGMIPAVGEYLGAIIGNVGIIATGVAVTVLVMRVVEIVKANIGELSGKSA